MYALCLGFFPKKNGVFVGTKIIGIRGVAGQYRVLLDGHG